VSDNLPRLIESLRNPTCYPDAPHVVELVETHISWLFLTGRYVYKIKKPVDLGFVDFSDLAKRRFYCQEELRLNRRFTPELYLDLVSITGSPQSPRLDAGGPAIEYAVKMRQFPGDARLDRVLERGELTAAHCDSLAESIAQAHASAEVAVAASPHGRPDAVQKQLIDTLRLAQARLDKRHRKRIEALAAWSVKEFARLLPELDWRKAAGFIRECHGDLHLENMVLLGDRVRLFDCLEFNPQLRWIDVMSDLAFVTMDLADRRRPDLANRLLNRYLEITNDYRGLMILSYYQVYRAVVRAAVAGIRLAELAGSEQAALANKADAYLALAESYTRPRRPGVVITHGLSGSGKSTVTQRLVEALGAMRLRSDVERRREPLPPTQRYAPSARRRVYERLAATAADIITAGYPVIVDATFLRRADRRLLEELALRRGTPFVILAFDVEPHVLRNRLGRRAGGSDPSEATEPLLDQQLRELEPLSKRELPHAIRVDATPDCAALAGRIRQIVAS
jgi:hypothetical protein